MFNVRTALWWALREALDPASNRGIQLPPSKQLLRDLTAPLWGVQGDKIRVEGRDKIITRTGKSPDRATAVMLALLDTPKAIHFRNMMYDRPLNDAPGGGEHKNNAGSYDPYSNLK